jgi:hypothetical protein
VDRHDKQARMESSMYRQGPFEWVVSVRDETFGGNRLHEHCTRPIAQQVLKDWRQGRAQKLRASAAAAAIGRIGGLSRSPEKIKAVKLNGAKGGRPRNMKEASWKS